MNKKYITKTKKELLNILQRRDKKIENLESKIIWLEKRILAYENVNLLIKRTGVFPFPNPVNGVVLSKLPNEIFNL